MHQGDLDGVKGVHHVNAVDCLTQWQVVGSCPHISEEFMLPLLQAMFAQFPFLILGFHVDNGGEYINQHAAKMLNKLHIELTKSRPRTSNDNALAETKNGAVVRKVFGYGHIAQEHAVRINAFNRVHLNPLLNLHRPCLFATEIADPHKPGRTRKVYRHSDVMTPLEKLATVPNAAAFLCTGISLKMLQDQAHAKTNLQAATDLNRAREKLFTSIHQAP